MTRRATHVGDRVFAGIMLVGAVWYWWYATTFSSGFGDPVGPTAFPRLIAIPTAICAILVLLRPGADGRWWHGRQTGMQGAALLVLLVYPALIETLGFPLSTAASAGLLALILNARPMAAVLTGLLAGALLFLLFDALLGLPLPLWPDL